MKFRFFDIWQATGFLTTVLFLLTALPTIPNCTAAEKFTEIEANSNDAATRASIAKSYGNLPLSFEVNNGQMDDAVKFISRGNGYTLFLTSTEAVLSLRRGSLKEKLQESRRNSKANKSRPAANDVVRLMAIGANPSPKITGLEELPGKSNYFIGKDAAKWRANVSNYEKVKIENAYPGIDLVYYGNQRQLEYDWIVNPGAHPKTIRFAIEGKANLKVNAQGDLILDEKSNLRLNKPFIYQKRAGSRTEIAGRYILLGKREIGFQMERYDASLPLVIDPVLSYSTYLGGAGNDFVQGIAVDSSGNAYIVGETQSTDFPTADPLQANGGGYSDAFVTKLNASGSALVYSTYLGGTGDTDSGLGITVDTSGCAYVTGRTDSSDFPTASPFQASQHGNGDAFVTKLNASGSVLVYSTYLGGTGSEYGVGIAVDTSDNAYVTGYTYSTDLPTANPFQANRGGSYDAFVTKLNASGSALIYSTYLGGSEFDEGWGIAVDSSGCAYVTGHAYSIDFPTANAFQSSHGGGDEENDAFVTKLNASGSALLYSTYLGGSSFDMSRSIAVDSSGNAYVTGYTGSTNFPTANPVQSNHGGGYSDAFVTKLSTSGSALLYSTYLGGSGSDSGDGIAVGSSGNAYVTGYTGSSNFPTASPFQASNNGDDDAFITKLNTSGSSLLYSTYLGGSGGDSSRGIVVDSYGNVYVTGVTTSADFPAANAFQSSNSGGFDAFVMKINLSRIVFGDFDGDGISDITVWRSTNGVWYSLPSNSPGSYTGSSWGVESDHPVAGDYDGDGKSDIAVWRPSEGVWYVLPSNSPATYTAIPWGLNSDIPVHGDYDGDGTDDIAVWRSDTGTWYILPSGSPGTYTSMQWGMNTDTTVPADYDGDGKADAAVWRLGTWYILKSSVPDTYSSTEWGMSSDIPVPGDYDADGKTDIAVWRPSTGVWYILPSSTPEDYTAISWGMDGDAPVLSDIDGDGRADISVWRPSDGTWYLLPSNSPGTYTATQWGVETDVPISSLTGILRAIP
jgi:hypothetical protein